MQSWPGSGQNGSPDEHSQWQPNFGFTGQNGQFDPSQSWTQPIPDQAGAYPQHMSPQDASPSNYFHSHQGDSFLSGHLHANPSNQPAFHAEHDALSLGQQYGQSAQDVIDPAFSNINPDLYGQQGKIALGNEINHIGHVQNHPHPHAQAQPFTQHDYAFASQNEQSYESPVQQYAQPHLVPQQARQQSHTPVQQFDNMHSSYTQNHGFSRPAQQSPAQHQQQASPQPSQPYPQAQTYSHSPVNGQNNQRYQTNAQLSYQPQPQQPPQQQGYTQPDYGLQKPLAYVQPGQPSTSQLLPHPPRQVSTPVNHSTPAGANVAYPTTHQTGSVDSAAFAGSVSSEPASKKRKRTVKGAMESPAVENATANMVDLTVDLNKRPDEVDSLIPPVPTAEEAHLMTKFAKRSKTAQAKQPSIKGLPHLLYEGSIRLPAPKSYDKLSPFVALPPRSGKQIVPELRYNLPCEIQGKFTSQYRPSINKIGLDERRAEAKVLLDGYDDSMKALGKRRPKYTEYPHAFKEQLKSDEATKNKAEKKAKRELEEAGGKPIRPATRPTDTVEAAVWDVFGFVHIDKTIEKTNTFIGTRVQQAGDLIIHLRSEANRAKLDFDQATKDKASEEELKRTKEESEQKREALYMALDATIEHADDRVLDNLGGHQKMVLSLVNALIACIKAGDFSSKMPKIVLELFTQVRMTKKIAETTNFDTVRKRFADKGDDEVKELVREISMRVKKVMKVAEPETATGYTGTSAASRAKTGGRPAESSSAKRSRDDDSDSRTVKKIAVESGGSALSKKLAQPKTAAPKPATSSLLPGKYRPNPKSVPKTEVVKADSPAGSGDDKAKVDAHKPAAKTETKPPAPKMGATPSSSALSGIASLLDSINAPKVEAAAPVAKEAKVPDLLETPEQKAKRLRKESRRKLRVSWKPEADLVEIKVFIKEDGEDEGREVNMIRDAADDRSEGMMLKQRANVEEDDEDDDIPYQPWSGPIAVDFSSIPGEVRDKNYVTRGGNVEFTTGEQQRITERGQRELMAIYTNPADIPSTPRSPPAEISVLDSEGKIGQLPTEGTKYREMRVRWLDTQQMGPDGALYAATSRLQMQNSTNKLDNILGRLNRVPAASQSSQQPSSSGQSVSGPYSNVPLVVGSTAEDLLLAWLASDKAKTWWDPQPANIDFSSVYSYVDPESQAAGSAIEELAKALIGKPFPATSPPEWIIGEEERVREWWFGYNKEAAARQRKADEDRARVEAETNASGGVAAGQVNLQDWTAYYAQQQQYAPYMALVQQMTGGAPQQPPPDAVASSAQQAQIPDSQLQSILAAINQPSQPAQLSAQQAQTAQEPNNFINPNDPSYQQYMMLAQMAHQGQQPAASAPTPSYDSEREWERGDDHHKGDKDARKKKGTLPPHKPANKALIGTKPCTFWQQGKCARGDKCTFRHD